MLSLETCLKLKEAGFRQDTMLCWQRRGNKWHDINLTAHVFPTKGAILAACPTLEELLEAVRELSEVGFNIECRDEYTIEDAHGLERYSGGNLSEAVAALWLKLKGIE